MNVGIYIGLLDYCQGLSNSQIRLVFESFAILEVANEGRANGGEVIILVKKLLAKPDLSLQRIGIIGCLCLINHLSKIGGDGVGDF